MTPVGSQRHKKKFVDNVKHIDKRTWSRVQFSYSGTGIYKQQQGRKFYFLCTLCYREQESMSQNCHGRWM